MNVLYWRKLAINDHHLFNNYYHILNSTSWVLRIQILRVQILTSTYTLPKLNYHVPTAIKNIMFTIFFIGITIEIHQNNTKIKSITILFLALQFYIIKGDSGQDLGGLNIESEYHSIMVEYLCSYNHIISISLLLDFNIWITAWVLIQHINCSPLLFITSPSRKETLNKE